MLECEPNNRTNRKHLSVLAAVYTIHFGQRICVYSKMLRTKKPWTFGQTQELIAAVKKHPCLYDRRDPTYNQAKFKEVNRVLQ